MQPKTKRVLAGGLVVSIAALGVAQAALDDAGDVRVGDRHATAAGAGVLIPPG